MKKLAVVAILALAACARHDEMPSALKVMEPPVPVDFSVTTADYVRYQLAWRVDDPSIVSYYRIYWKFGYSSAALMDSTVQTFAHVEIQPNVPVPGMIFCVSSVTTENVESRLECKSAD